MTSPTRPVAYNLERIYRCVKSQTQQLGLDPGDQDSIELISEAILDYPYGDTAHWVENMVRRYWSFESEDEEMEFADQLEYVESAIRRDHEDEIEEWILSSGILPRLSLHQEIQFQYGKTYQGSIVEIRELSGEYVVYVEEMGHVKRGEVGTLGIVLPYEQLHDIVPPPEEFCLRSPFSRNPL